MNRLARIFINREFKKLGLIEGSDCIFYNVADGFRTGKIIRTYVRDDGYVLVRISHNDKEYMAIHYKTAVERQQAAFHNNVFMGNEKYMLSGNPHNAYLSDTIEEAIQRENQRNNS